MIHPRYVVDSEGPPLWASILVTVLWAVLWPVITIFVLPYVSGHGWSPPSIYLVELIHR